MKKRWLALALAGAVASVVVVKKAKKSDESQEEVQSENK